MTDCPRCARMESVVEAAREVAKVERSMARYGREPGAVRDHHIKVLHETGERLQASLDALDVSGGKETE